MGTTSLARYATLLDEREQRKAARYVFERDRRNSVVSRGALRELAFAPDRARDALHLACDTFVDFDHIIKRIRDAPGDACPFAGQAHGKVSTLERGQSVQDCFFVKGVRLSFVISHDFRRSSG